MEVHVRPFQFDRDAAALVAIHNQWHALPQTVERLAEATAAASEEFRHVRGMAETDDGSPLGYFDAWPQDWDGPDTLQVEVVVDSAWRSRGVGTQLYAAMVQTLGACAGCTLASSVRDNDETSLQFMLRRGFAVDRHSLESFLDLASFTEAPFVGAIERQEAAGIRFSSLADLHDSADGRHKLFEISAATTTDVPGWSVPVPTFDEFRASVFEPSWYDPAGQIVAVAPGEEDVLAAPWIGLTAIGYFPDSHLAFQMFTGVHRAWRGRGVATALKLLGIRHAQAVGALKLGTANDAQSVLMLGINSKLGFRPEPGIFTLLRPPHPLPYSG